MQESVPQEVVRSINPASGEMIAEYTLLSAGGIDATLDQAQSAFHRWRALPVRSRAGVLQQIAAGLRSHKAALARLITLEMGKVITEAEAEVEKSAWACEYIAEHGEQWLADDMVRTSAALSYVSYHPLGPVLAILPWNFPVWQVFRCAASAMMAGNTIVLKHAPNVLGCAQFITQIIAQTDAPPGLLVNCPVPVEAVAGIIADRRIAAVTLTGSPGAGRKVAALAGAACKKSVLELGGSDAFIVLADADLEPAVQAAIRARFTNCGQVCLAAKRFLLEAPIAEAFTQRFVAAAAALRVGDPLERSTQLGPMARDDLRGELQRQVDQSVQAGARLLTGGHSSSGKGWFHTPTVLTDVTKSMPVYAQETFGPVAAMFAVKDADEAVATANDSAFGLSTMLWTQDTKLAAQLARRLEVGSVFVNSVTASDPRMPVGGVKLSGYGRELGQAGLHELCNLQTVWMA
jgi:succinate-semialdehyde dehydrogenase/glutarate-semialdehyde dehydrogenase